MDEKCFSQFNGYQVKDATARRKLESFTTVKAHGAKGDGVTDDTAAINDALDSGCGMVYFPAGTYLVNGLVSSYYDNMDNSGLIVKSNTNIVLAPGAVIQQTGGTNSERSVIFNLNGVENVEICGGTLIGDSETHIFGTSGSSDEWGHGISIRKSKNVYIHDMTIKNMSGDGIYVGQTGTYSDTTDVHNYNVMIERCNITHIGRNGISMTECNGWKINDCRITDVYRTSPMSAIDVELEGDYEPVCKNGHISNCYFSGVYAGIHNWTTGELLTVENCRGANSVYMGGSITKLRNVPGTYIAYENADIESTDSDMALLAESYCKVKLVNCAFKANGQTYADIEMHNCKTNGSIIFSGGLLAVGTTFNIDDGDYALYLRGEKNLIKDCTFVRKVAPAYHALTVATGTKLVMIGCNVINEMDNTSNYAMFNNNGGEVVTNNCYSGFASVAAVDLAEGCVNFNA